MRVNVDELAPRVAKHIGAELRPDGTMPCPKCGGDFGPTMSLTSLSIYEDGYLPGSPLLNGVCLDCGHVTNPAVTPIDPDLLVSPTRTDGEVGQA